MTKSGKPAKSSWLSDLAPIGIAVLVVVAAAVGFRLLYATEKAASSKAIGDAQREAFLKQHYPNDLTSANGAPRSAAPPANSR
jgi:negative regulator of sigma E activity